MLKIDGNTIYLTCGDNAKINVAAIDTNGDYYAFRVGDKLTLTVKSSNKKSDTTTLFQKTVTATVANVTSLDIPIDPEDTADLAFTTYYYDIQLTRYDGWIDTIVESSKFKVGVGIG